MASTKPVKRELFHKEAYEDRHENNLRITYAPKIPYSGQL